MRDTTKLTTFCSPCEFCCSRDGV